MRNLLFYLALVVVPYLCRSLSRVRNNTDSTMYPKPSRLRDYGGRDIEFPLYGSHRSSRCRYCNEGRQHAGPYRSDQTREGIITEHGLRQRRGHVDISCALSGGNAAETEMDGLRRRPGQLFKSGRDNEMGEDGSDEETSAFWANVNIDKPYGQRRRSESANFKFARLGKMPTDSRAQSGSEVKSAARMQTISKMRTLQSADLQPPSRTPIRPQVNEEREPSQSVVPKDDSNYSRRLEKKKTLPITSRGPILRRPGSSQLDAGLNVSGPSETIQIPSPVARQRFTENTMVRDGPLVRRVLEPRVRNPVLVLEQDSANPELSNSSTLKSVVFRVQNEAEAYEPAEVEIKAVAKPKFIIRSDVSSKEASPRKEASKESEPFKIVDVEQQRSISSRQKQDRIKSTLGVTSVKTRDAHRVEPGAHIITKRCAQVMAITHQANESNQISQGLEEVLAISKPNDMTIHPDK